jgi:hypothetical protein
MEVTAVNEDCQKSNDTFVWINDISDDMNRPHLR